MTSRALPAPLHDDDPLAALAVDHVCDLSVDLEDPLVFPTPFGTRLTYVARHGTVAGPRIRGDFLGGAGDWVLVVTDGIGRMDVRGTIRTDDGVLIHYASLGIARLPADGGKTIAAGGRIPYGTSYIRTTPRFETSDERYSWLTERVLIGINELSAGHIDWRIYSVA